MKWAEAEGAGEVSSWKKRGSGEPYSSLQVPERRLWPSGFGLFSQVTKDNTMGNGLESHQGSFRLSIMNIFFTKGVVRQWNILIRVVVESPFLEVLKKWVDVVLLNMVLIHVIFKGWIDDLRGLFKPWWFHVWFHDWGHQGDLLSKFWLKTIISSCKALIKCIFHGFLQLIGDILISPMLIPGSQHGFILDSQNHRIMELFGLKETLKTILSILFHSLAWSGAASSIPGYSQSQLTQPWTLPILNVQSPCCAYCRKIIHWVEHKLETSHPLPQLESE